MRSRVGNPLFRTVLSAASVAEDDLGFGGAPPRDEQLRDANLRLRSLLPSLAGVARHDVFAVANAAGELIYTRVAPERFGDSLASACRRSRRRRKAKRPRRSGASPRTCPPNLRSRRCRRRAPSMRSWPSRWCSATSCTGWCWSAPASIATRSTRCARSPACTWRCSATTRTSSRRSAQRRARRSSRSSRKRRSAVRMPVSRRHASGSSPASAGWSRARRSFRAKSASASCCSRRSTPNWVSCARSSGASSGSAPRSSRWRSASRSCWPAASPTRGANSRVQRARRRGRSRHARRRHHRRRTRAARRQLQPDGRGPARARPHPPHLRATCLAGSRRRAAAASRGARAARRASRP